MFFSAGWFGFFFSFSFKFFWVRSWPHVFEDSLKLLLHKLQLLKCWEDRYAYISTSEVVLTLSACGLPLSLATPGASNPEAHEARELISVASYLRRPCVATILLSCSKELETGHCWYTNSIQYDGWIPLWSVIGENYLWGMFCVWKKVERNNKGIKTRLKQCTLYWFHQTKWMSVLRGGREIPLKQAQALPLVLALRSHTQHFPSRRSSLPGYGLRFPTFMLK